MKNKLIHNSVIVYFMMINPEIAVELLKKNHPKNRSLRTGHVRYLEREMRAGRFFMNGETIIFDSDGYLIDGQHRLRAIIASGVTLEFLIVEGVVPPAYHSIDGGAARVAGDAIGVKSNKNAVAAAARFLIIYQDGDLSYEANDKVGNKQIADFVVSNPRIAEIANSIHGNMSNFRGTGFSLSIAAACMFLFESVDSVAAQEFERQVIRRIGVQEGTTTANFIKFISNAHGPRRKLAPNVASACFIKAFNAFMKGHTIKTFRYVPASEPYPQVDGCKFNPKSVSA